MHSLIHILAWTGCFIATVQAQSTSTTTGSSSSNVDVVTSYISVCPSSTSTTITLPGTTIVCAGDGPCASPAPTTPPNSLVTLTGDDGRTTIYRTETTILPHMCPQNDGVCGAIYTLSEQCPCSGPETIVPGKCPEWFTTTVVACKACAEMGGPSTVVLTTPVASGPYATVTPAYGPPVSAPSAIAPPPASGPAPAPSPTSQGPSNNTSSGEAAAVPAPAPTTVSSSGPAGPAGPATTATNPVPSASPSTQATNGTTSGGQVPQTYEGAGNKIAICASGLISAIVALTILL